MMQVELKINGKLIQRADVTWLADGVYKLEYHILDEVSHEIVSHDLGTVRHRRKPPPEGALLLAARVLDSVVTRMERKRSGRIE